MNTKATLPPLDDDLAAPRRVNLRAIQSPTQTDDATVDENSRTLGGRWGAQTSLATPRSKTPLASLRIEVPEYLDRELALKAVEQRVTKQFLVVQALRDAGFHVDLVDLVADKRKVKK